MPTVPQPATSATLDRGPGQARPVPRSTYDWETGVHTYDASQMDARAIWRTCVATAVTKAYQNLPDSHGRIDKALHLVLGDAVDMQADATALVTAADGTTRYHVGGGSCTCPDAPQAPRGYCKHRIARLLVLRAREVAKAFGTGATPVQIAPAAVPDLTTEDPAPTPEPAPPPAGTPTRKRPRKPVAVASRPEVVSPTPPTVNGAPATLDALETVHATWTIPAEFLYERHGTTAILFGGLLHLATERGLIGLTEAPTHVTETYVMATATATFRDGRVFTGLGDSTPENVGKMVQPHWRRMAGTRAKARALRDALDIPYVCVVELTDE